VLPLLELGTGFHQELTGRENILLNGVLLGLTLREIEEKMPKIIEFSELKEFIDQPIRTYSSGMLARLGFSIIIHSEPDILLIDEILAVGDLSFQKKCLQKILDFKKKGITIVYVTHNIQDLQTMCDRALWLENHEIKLLGPAQEVANEYLQTMEA
ncbi:MAG: ABC transporter ATP-binding protein, partial [Caldimicrobium sp.]